MADYDKYKKDMEELGFDFLDLSIDLRKHPELAKKMTKEQKRLRQRKINAKSLTSMPRFLTTAQGQYGKEIIRLLELLSKKGLITEEEFTIILSDN
jgi:Fe-S cluster assembly scaffold protein SufB